MNFSYLVIISAWKNWKCKLIKINLYKLIYIPFGKESPIGYRHYILLSHKIFQPSRCLEKKTAVLIKCCNLTNKYWLLKIVSTADCSFSFSPQFNCSLFSFWFKIMNMIALAMSASQKSDWLALIYLLADLVGFSYPS